MDGLAAKRVFIALAKKFSCTSVRRCNCDHGYKLKFILPSGRIHLVLGYVDDKYAPWGSTLKFSSTKWTKMLQDLEGKTLAVGSERLNVISIEQLIIDLQLQGYLKNV